MLQPWVNVYYRHEHSLVKDHNAVDLSNAVTGCGDPNRRSILLLLRNCNFATVMNRKVNI